ncbi:MAG: hypothetical protein H8E80_05385 [Desulfobacteraceae bacterium]|uniref:Uncharacterized protein n=1 Tax=Candidatus Desulfaltia bathyphila TaxID=2841697 RepID=A0A8J6N6L2_9BACT|nr:hypothetical protein [Candidatus Desulfaltia bathyphila]MBL7195033.1 hypothetical protein [Desulfobacterales bacterium]
MTGKWKEVVKLTFKGERFRDHALDLQALGELSQFQKMVAETAKTLWRAANPNRERLPSHFEERVRLCLRRIEDGSATAPLEVFIEENDQRTFWGPEPVEIKEAVKLAHEVFEAIGADAQLPERFPRALLSEYAKWGQSLADDEAVELHVPDKKPARLTLVHKKRLEKYVETPHEDHVEISGEVFEADVKKGRFQLWSGEDTAVTVVFTPEQEYQVTTALKEHKTARMYVKGSGEYSPQGTLLRVLQVDELRLTTSETHYDKSARPIEDLLEELAREIPQEEWDKLPSDLNDNLDHYLYGVPKR